MASSQGFERVFTQLDYVRIMRLITPGSDRFSEIQRAVESLLHDGEVVPSPSVPPQVVTMYSQVVIQEAGHEPRQVVLCYPADAEPARGFISVFSPVGLALLGLRVGQVACWHAPDGKEHVATISALLFQPEGSGDYTT